MYIMYVDESGDCGLKKSPTDFFVLSGLVIHELRWSECLTRMIEFRQRMAQKFRLRVREEWHTARFISRPGHLRIIPKNDRLAMYRHCLNEIAQLPDVSLVNVVVKKTGKPEGYNVFDTAWRALIQRFENTVSHRNFPGPRNADDRGMIFPDHTDDKKLRGLTRKMRVFNPVPNRISHGVGYRNIRLNYVIEDPNFRDSRDSYFIQAVDAVAYALHQMVRPCSYIRMKGAKNYFQRLEPALCKVASTSDPLGIVWL